MCRHATYLSELDPETAGRIMKTGQRLAAALRASGLRCDGVNLLLADGEAAGSDPRGKRSTSRPRKSVALCRSDVEDITRTGLFLLTLFASACGGTDVPRATAPQAQARAVASSVPAPEARIVRASEWASDPTVPHVVAFDDGDFQNAAWSPDGRMLALTQSKHVVVLDGATIRLRVPHGGYMPAVRFDGSTLSIDDHKTESRFDLATGARVDAPSAPRTAPQGPHETDTRRTFALEGGGWVDIVETSTSTKTVVQKPAYFNDDTGVHQYTAPFDVIHTTTRVSATRVAKDGTRITRPLVSLKCESEAQQPDTIQRAGDLPRTTIESALGGGLQTRAFGTCEGLSGTEVSPDGGLVAVQTGRRRLTIVSLASGRRDDLPATDGATTVVSFGPGGRRVLWQTREASSVRTRLFDVNTAPARLMWNVTSLPEAPEGGVAAFSPDGSRIALVAGETVAIVQASNGTISGAVSAHRTAILTAIAARPGALLLGTDGGVVYVVTPGGIAHVAVFAKDRVGALAWSPSGTTFAVAAGFFGQPPADRRIAVFDAAGNAVRALASPADDTWDLAFSPDGARLAAATSDKDLLSWSTADGSGPARTSTSYTGGRASVATSPTLSAIAEDNRVALLRSDTGAIAGMVDVPAGRAERVRFSADGTTLYVLTRTAITAFDAATRAQKWTSVLGEDAKDASGLAVGPDATLLVTGWAMRTHLRSAADGSLLLDIVGDTNPAAAFSGRASPSRSRRDCACSRATERWSPRCGSRPTAPARTSRPTDAPRSSARSQAGAKRRASCSRTPPATVRVGTGFWRSSWRCHRAKLARRRLRAHPRRAPPVRAPRRTTARLPSCNRNLPPRCPRRRPRLLRPHLRPRARGRSRPLATRLGASP